MHRNMNGDDAASRERVMLIHIYFETHKGLSEGKIHNLDIFLFATLVNPTQNFFFEKKNL